MKKSVAVLMILALVLSLGASALAATAYPDAYGTYYPDDYGYDFDVKALSRTELEPYNEEARELGMTTYDIVDRGDYILICLGRLE